MPKKRGSGQSKSLTLEELSANFHLPINDVARKLGLCVTVLKQRCREHGITRWPYRKVKKLDNIISALQAPAVESSGNDSNRRLESVKKTREVLITDPNSKAHLRIGKLKKAVRKRAGLAGLMARDNGSGSGSESGGSGSSDRVIIGSGGGFQPVMAGNGGYSIGGGGASEGFDNKEQKREYRSAFVGLGGGGGGGGSGAMDGLLEAAASLSDGETPGTPTRDQGDELRDRSPRISGCIAPEAIGAMMMGVGTGTAGMVAPPAAGGGPGVWDAAAVLGALKPGGAFTPVVAPRPTRPMPLNAATGVLPRDQQQTTAAATTTAAPSKVTPPVDPGSLYAAAMAAFQTAAGAGVAAAAPPPPPPPPPSCPPVPGLNPQSQMAAAIGSMNPHMAQMFAWMAAIGAGAQQQQQQQHLCPPQPLPNPWNPAALQQMAAAAARASTPTAPAAAPPAPPPPPQHLQVAHQPL